MESRRASLANRSMSGSLSIREIEIFLCIGILVDILALLGEASGDLPGVNFLAGMPRLPRRSLPKLLRRSRPRPMLPRRAAPASGLARLYGSGVRRGLLEAQQYIYIQGYCLSKMAWPIF